MGDGAPTAIDLPRNLSRPARGVYFAACLLADEAGEVHGGQAAIRAAVGYDGRSAVSEAITELEGCRLVVTRGSTRGQRLFVVVLARKGEQSGCEVCGRLPLARINGAKHCATCYQTHGRPDRRWKVVAMEVWARGVMQGLSDMAIAYAIHTATKQPLWGTSDEHAENGRRGGGGSTLANGAAVEGVIPWGVSAGLFDASMMALVRRARRGEDEGE